MAAVSSPSLQTCTNMTSLGNRGTPTTIKTDGCHKLQSSFLQHMIYKQENLPKLTASSRCRKNFTIFDEIGGQYEETFVDVERQMINIFTFKALRTVLAQLQETDPVKHKYLYNFAVENKPSDGKFFLQALFKDNQELASRLLEVRVHLFTTWSKGYNSKNLYKVIADQNVELLRERLLQTVKFVEEESRPEIDS